MTETYQKSKIEAAVIRCLGPLANKTCKICHGRGYFTVITQKREAGKAPEAARIYRPCKCAQKHPDFKTVDISLRNDLGGDQTQPEATA